jgi:hypothetical protein
VPDPRDPSLILGYAGGVQRFLVGPVLVLISLAPACGGEPAPKMVAAKNDGVPANSASEERLAGGGTAKPKPAETTVDPSQPLTTPVSAEGSGSGASSGNTTAAAAAPAGKPGAKGAGGPKASKAECKQLFDKYIDLTIGTDSRFEGIPPEMIAQMKEAALAQAKSEKGDPCSTQEVTRTQYNCAMGSTSTAAWQKCLK